MFLDRHSKTKLVPASCSYFLEFLREKNEFFYFSLQRVIVLTVIIFLHYKETNQNALLKIQ